MATFLRRAFITLLLFVLAAFVIHYSWQRRKVVNNNFSFNEKESISLRYFPRAMHAYGLQAWFDSNPMEAAGFFRQDVYNDPFHIDGWIRLAQAELALGNLETSQEMLRFTFNLTRPIFRWKWKQMLLAHELGLEDVLMQIANYFLANGRMTSNTLQMIETHFNGDAQRIAGALSEKGLLAYLEWLMSWGSLEDVDFVWKKLVGSQGVDDKTVLKYVHYLIKKKHIVEASRVWEKVTGIKGMTNGDFEADIKNLGFDWRYWGNKNWEIKRIKEPGAEGSYCAQVIFYGKSNISFHNLYQIVPVEPLKRYAISYLWKSDEITTDQGPFVEIYGYDTKGLYEKSPMITGTHDWRQDSIEFLPPENCHAVVVRLRRLPSKRFDCNIKGMLFLDNFIVNIVTLKNY